MPWKTGLNFDLFLAQGQVFKTTIVTRKGLSPRPVFFVLGLGTAFCYQKSQPLAAEIFIQICQSTEYNLNTI